MIFVPTDIYLMEKLRLYLAQDILEKQPPSENKKIAENSNQNINNIDYVRQNMYLNDIAEIKKQLQNQNEAIMEILKKLSGLESKS